MNAHEKDKPPESPRVVSEKLARVADKIHARLKEPGHILGRAGLREDIRYARELLCLIEQVERYPLSESGGSHG